MPSGASSAETGGVAPGPILEIDDLRTHFHTRDGVVRAVDGVSFHVNRGETLGVVGESGCGKSVTAMSILRLLPQPPARIESGTIRFEGTNLLELGEGEMRDIRGNEISMIFQEPMTSLNPVLTVGRQISESIALHQGLSERAAHARAIEMLDRVRVPDARRRADEYPHQPLRRHASAGDDRHGAVLQSEGADSRRADDRARRHHPGSDPRSDA